MLFLSKQQERENCYFDWQVNSGNVQSPTKKLKIKKKSEFLISKWKLIEKPEKPHSSKKQSQSIAFHELFTKLKKLV